MKRYFLSIVMLFMLGALSFISPAYSEEGSPIDLLQSVADKMIASLKANKTTLKENPTLVYSLANKIIVPHADLNEMSKRVLPPQTWNAAAPSQKKEFERQFTTLLVRTYASALAGYKDQTVRFYPVRGGYAGKSSVRVNSDIIRADGPSISVVYSLVYKEGQWKLYDMTVEGVSMLESFRSQFSDQLSRGNIVSLINVLKQHNYSGRSGE